MLYVLRSSKPRFQNFIKRNL